MILANVTTPLLGLVDTAVLGHMDTPAMLAGASIGALILTQIYWVCGFLRMSATGLSGQAKGDPEDPTLASARVLMQTGSLALILGLVLLVVQSLILQAGLALADSSAEVSGHIVSYFQVRVWGAPAAMLNLVLVGWLVGQQMTRHVLAIQVLGNLLNAVLDVYLVMGLNWSVKGVALASVAAEYCMAVLALWLALRRCKSVRPQRGWFNQVARKMLLKLNGNMLLRNLILQACIAFITLQGARLGETSAAVNAILMQFFVLIALGLDGVAYAVEALVAEACGGRKTHGIRAHTHQGLVWSSLFAILYAVLFFTMGERIVNWLTDMQELQRATYAYLPLMVALPLLAHWCFLFDGVFVGLTRSKAMRDTMFISAAVVFFPVWWSTRELGNVALWYALLAFLLARGLSLGATFCWLSRRNLLTCP
ncbi:MATE family efflux transporter [Alteromonas aestuariivivens]|uniref:MATE family efflux transporter n=2 Tax=Alteromonas aestuariivivens TaxID=1938339 RepID=A0A3D8M5V9_9ALTE|nr:MATE family efflux transporter [Alteromonas aestuariivivens]